MGHLLKMKPVFKEMIWGGTRLKEEYGYAIPSDHTGECWAISAHPNGDGMIVSGEFAGQTLSQVFNEHKELFGNIKDEQFPLLVKIIDASRDLSVQVHPDDTYAKIHENSLGKTESWYVLGVKENTQMVMGHFAKSKEELIERIENNEYDQLLNRFPIKKGDFFYIPSGTIHAICAGSLIYEAQQSSDITYRVYDYNRKDANGNLRQLHVKQSIDVIQVPYDSSKQSQPQVIKNVNYDEIIYAKSKFFTVKKWNVKSSTTITHQEPFSLVSIIEGQGTMNEYAVKKGDHFVVCSDVNELKLDGQMEIMVTTL